ncbi:HEAT repeat domain-containing protein [Tautonia plasticadhaerens]|uniref:HEAT repeat protein n=1 Tax=Tautonia plasticadhaerens TaxID=2527974 RepID=A0A518HCK2_9BACT|nr:HEAT repeat domain-containing protein [Tautonia plasticadhaerens]QDV38579.1 hypothetical protein ElP_65340 [Tautonia plasticadhaerens]
MTGAIACSTVLAAQLAVGGLGLFDCLKAKHDRDDHRYDGPGCCRSCLSEYREVQGLLVVMQRHPSWKERDDAAHDLRDFDWRCHPDLAPTLASAMLGDCHEEVREEAAETLARLAPRDGMAHLALRQAAHSDPDHATRKWARRALDRLDDRCLTDCPICGPVTPVEPTGFASPVPTGYDVEVEVLPPARGPRIHGDVPFDLSLPLEERSEWSTPAPALPGGVDPVDPGPQPGLLPPALAPPDGPIEILPPAEPPPPVPPAVSPFGASRDRAGPVTRALSRAGGPTRPFAVGRPR